MAKLTFKPIPYHLETFHCSMKREDANRFHELLRGIRPTYGKIRKIVPGDHTYQIDLVLYEEELAFLKLAIPSFQIEWTCFDMHQVD